MKAFFKIFFASFLAMLIFSILAVVAGLVILGAALQPSKPSIGSKALLVLDLSTAYPEQAKENPLSSFTGKTNYNTPGLYDIVRMIAHAKTDSTIKGIYIQCGSNGNGFAASEELRDALSDFRQSRKFVLAYGEAIDQKSYYVATAADKIYCHPQGGVDWNGFSATLTFMKGLLDKLEIQPQIFYAGKYKSATEPLRVTKMSDPNRAQTSELLGDLYNQFLTAASAARNIDTATLRSLSVNGSIQTANDALKYGLVDGLKYDDEMKSIIQQMIGLKEKDKINFVSMSTYAEAVHFKSNGDGKIALIYASGDIVDGKSQDETITSEEFTEMIRKARLDDNVKAIVFRVNSPGGSSLASDAIWREITLAKETKPVVVSMGNYAASGGYYIACNADSIFADRGTVTGSIGVFSVIPNLQPFFNNKLGITFDGVKTAPYADMGSVSRPLSETEKKFFQSSVDSIYSTFKQRVADGREKDIVYIDSIAQGHVYTGTRGLQLGLTDKIGGLQQAVECAARMAGVKNFYTAEYPEKKGWIDELLNAGNISSDKKAKLIKEEVGEQPYKMLQQLKQLENMMNIPQTKMPFEYIFN